MKPPCVSPEKSVLHKQIVPVELVTCELVDSDKTNKGNVSNITAKFYEFINLIRYGKL